MLLVTIGDTSTHKLAAGANMQMDGGSFQQLDLYLVSIPSPSLSRGKSKHYSRGSVLSGCLNKKAKQVSAWRFSTPLHPPNLNLDTLKEKIQTAVVYSRL